MCNSVHGGDATVGNFDFTVVCQMLGGHLYTTLGTSLNAMDSLGSLLKRYQCLLIFFFSSQGLIIALCTEETTSENILLCGV